MSPLRRVSPRLVEGGALAGIVLVAALLRLWDLGQLPPGLYRDEAFNGLDARGVLRGQLALFFPANHGREPLLIYLQAASVGLLGSSALAVRLPAALLGLATVPAVYLAARSLYGARVGLLAAWVTAVGFWPLALSRVGFRAVALPLVSALFVWAAARAWRRPARRTWLVAGGLLGLSLYTYTAARLVPLAVLLSLGHLAWRRRGLPGGAWLAVAAAVVVALPLLASAGREGLLLRPGQVSILAADRPVETFGRQLAGAAGMWLLEGDAIARHNLPGRPVFDPALGAAFLAGIVVVARRLREPRFALPLVWTMVLLLPTLLAEDAPHFLRGSGVLPLALFLPALGLAWLSRRRHGLLLLAPFLVWPLLATSGDYFGRYVRLDGTAYAFDGAYRTLAEEGRAYPGQVYVAPELRDHPTVRFLLPDAVEKVDGAPAMLLLWPHRQIADELAMLPPGEVIAHRPGGLHRGDRDPGPALLYEVFTADQGGLVPIQPRARWRSGLRLEGALVWPQDAENAVRVALFWQADQPLAADYTVFVHVLEGERLIGQHDGQPLDGRFPTRLWRPGDTYQDVHRVELPGNYDRSAQRVIAGLYQPASGRRLVLEGGGDFVVLDEP